MRFLVLSFVFLVTFWCPGYAQTGRLGSAAGAAASSGYRSRFFMGSGVQKHQTVAEFFGISPKNAIQDQDLDGAPDIVDPDNDGDTLTDRAEIETWRTNLNRQDSDYDQLSDDKEVGTYGTNPIKADTDGDGLVDGWEVEHGFNPRTDADLDVDSDGDGYTNAQEIDRGTNPAVYELELFTGWNLVSLARVPDSYQAEDIFPEDVFGPVWVWNPEDGRYETCEEIVPLKGHWVFSEEHVVLEITLPNTVNAYVVP